MKSTILILVLGTSLMVSAQQKTAVYLDVTKPIEERVENALLLITTKEKVELCYAQSKFSSKGVARLGIPEIWSADGSHGISDEKIWDDWGGAGWTNDSCTAFPALNVWLLPSIRQYRFFMVSLLVKKHDIAIKPCYSARE